MEEAGSLLVLVDFELPVDEDDEYIHELQSIVVLLRDLVLSDKHLNFITKGVLNGEEVLVLKCLFVIVEHLSHFQFVLLLLSNEGLQNTLVLLQVDLQTSC